MFCLYTNLLHLCTRINLFMPMKSILSIFIFLCLVLLGTQDKIDTDVFAHGINSRTYSIEETIQSPSSQSQNKRIFHFPASYELNQIGYCISCERENNSLSFHTKRLLSKFHCNFLRKDFNTRQKISELTSTFQTATCSTLHYRFAHLIYLLLKIII